MWILVRDHPRSAVIMMLDFPASSTMRIIVYKPSVLGILLWQSEQTKTLGNGVTNSEHMFIRKVYRVEPTWQRE